MNVQNRLFDLWLAKCAQERRPIPVAEVARGCGMSRQNLEKWFDNIPQSCPYKTMAAFCKYFECGPGDLFVVKAAEVAQ